MQTAIAVFGVLLVIAGIYIVVKNAGAIGATAAELPGGIKINTPSGIVIIILGVGLVVFPFTQFYTNITPAPRAESSTSAAAPPQSGPTAGNGGVQTNTPDSKATSEVAQYAANVFSDTQLSAVIGRTEVDKSYDVACRIPPSPDQPSSVGKGGFYRLVSNGYVPANTFQNGSLPNNNPYDPAVPLC